MNGPIDAASTRQLAVGGVDDRIDRLKRDVALKQNDLGHDPDRSVRSQMDRTECARRE